MEPNFSSEINKTRVRVVARFRPLNDQERNMRPTVFVNFDQHDQNLVRINEQEVKGGHQFKFDKIF